MQPTTPRVGSATLILIGILGFAIGFGVIFFLLSRQGASPTPPEPAVVDGDITGIAEESDGLEMIKAPIAPEPPMTGTEAGTPAIGNAIVANDQEAGVRVTVATASMGKTSGWVVIHEDDRGGPGAILGARRLDGGVYTNVVVELLRATLPGRVYYAMLHEDDGDKLFDLRKDLPITDGSGEPFMVRFLTMGE